MPSLQIVYEFTQESVANVIVTDTFSLHPTTGVIALRQALNFEAQPIYSFGVIAQDTSSSPHNSTVTVM